MTNEMAKDQAAKAKVTNPVKKDDCPACATPAEKWTGSMPASIINNSKGPSENVTTAAPTIDPKNPPKKGPSAADRSKASGLNVTAGVE